MSKDSLFIKIQDIETGTWIVNKRHIVSAGISKGGKVTRVVLSTGAIIDSYLSYLQLEQDLLEIGHKTNPEAEIQPPKE